MYKMAVSEWFNELQHLSPIQLRKGLDNYRGEYPPNLIQFYNACTQKPIGKPAPCYAMYRGESDRKSLEHIDSSVMPVSKERGNEWLAGIRRGDLIVDDE